jgi:hypothetical protein
MQASLFQLGKKFSALAFKFIRFFATPTDVQFFYV